MKKVLSTLGILVIGLMIFTGQKFEDNPRWVNNPAFTEMRQGVYNQLPANQEVYIPITSPRYIMSPMGVTAVNPSFRIFPSTITQNEVIIVCCRTNQNWMFASANTIPGSTINAGDYYTTNSGVNWAGFDYINNGNTANQRSDPGPAYDKNGVILFTHITSATNFGAVTGIGGEYSSNRGANFSATFQIDNSADDDKNLAGTDDSPSSPYYGNSYVAWCRFTAGNFPAVIYTSRTTNSGVSWQTPIVVNSTNANHFSQGSDVCVGPNGYVYITWAQEQNASPYPGDSIGFARSTDGGVSYTANNNAFDCAGTRSTSYNGWGFRTNDFPRMDVDKSGGPRNGWIYVVRPQINLAPAGTDGDIVMNRSTDNGLTWSAGIRVNQDPLNNGKAQWFPAIRVDEYGGVNVIYYDNRSWANTGDSATIYVSRSIDGGNTFTDIKLSDHNFKPTWSTQIGDYIGITSGNNKIWGIWMDNKAGTCNAWVASIDLGPSINHTPLTNTEQTTGNRAVDASVIPAGSGINPSTAKLYYSKDNPTITTNVPLTYSSGTNWSANLPITGAGLYRYYLTVTDSLGRIATAPAGAPANYYSFIASPDTVKPVIVTTPLGDVPKATWPATVTATVTDNIGVDSSWVKWYKNNTSTGIKQFKLLNTSGSTFAAVFNSLNADVAVNDSIFYKVFAQDISSNHNRDSSALMKFKIIQLTNICVGTGTVSSNYPFATYWGGARTQMLFTAAEITAAGGVVNALVSKIGFNVITADPGVMNQFNINIQNTTATTLTTYINSGWTNIYTGTYTVPGTGWQYINCPSSTFHWNGTNLLLEVCFTNPSYTQYSTVNSTTMTGMQLGYYMDGITGCSTAVYNTVTSRPNVCFTMTVASDVNNQFTGVPTIYSLSQNYPNPFNPTTKINFALPKQGLVTLRIYDVLGREVRTLVNEVKSAGTYSVDFNASEYSSGVYFYRLESNGFSDIKRMMLIK
jgi:Secretion system C-terminal sorting domain